MTTFSAYLLDFIKEGTPEWYYCEAHSSGNVMSGRDKAKELSSMSGSNRTPYYIYFSLNQKKFVLITNNIYSMIDMTNDELFMHDMRKDIGNHISKSNFSFRRSRRNKSVRKSRRRRSKSVKKSRSKRNKSVRKSKRRKSLRKSRRRN
jgi:hypothetical protein